MPSSANLEQTRPKSLVGQRGPLHIGEILSRVLARHELLEDAPPQNPLAVSPKMVPLIPAELATSPDFQVLSSVLV